MTKRWRSRILGSVQCGCLCIVLGGNAQAALPRGQVSLHADTVKLSDLFSDLEPGQDCDLGPSPAPGNRIVVEEPQLAAIAQQYGVDWQPGLLQVRVVLERRARIVGRDALLPLLREALTGAGAPHNADIALGGNPKLVLPAEMTGPPEVTSFNYDQTSGRFSAELQFDGPLAQPALLHVEGSAVEMVEVPVLAHNLRAGTVLAASDFASRRMRKTRLGDGAVLDVSSAVGLALRHPALADQVMQTSELIRPALVSKGMPIILRLENQGIVLTAQGQALEDGALADRIHVLNTTSRAILVAEVAGPAQVQVDPSSAPVFARGSMGTSLPAYSQANLPPPYTN